MTRWRPPTIAAVDPDRRLAALAASLAAYRGMEASFPERVGALRRRRAAWGLAVVVLECLRARRRAWRAVA